MICPAGHIPGLQVAFPIAVEAARRDKGPYRERAAPKPAQARRTLFWISVILQAGKIVVAAADMRQARRRSRSRRDCGRPATRQALVVEEGAPCRVRRCRAHHWPDYRSSRAIIVPLALQADRYREIAGMPCREVGGAVERIDDPDVALVGAFAMAAFLADETVARPRLG